MCKDRKPSTEMKKTVGRNWFTRECENFILVKLILRCLLDHQMENNGGRWIYKFGVQGRGLS